MGGVEGRGNGLWGAWEEGRKGGGGAKRWPISHPHEHRCRTTGYSLSTPPSLAPEGTGAGGGLLWLLLALTSASSPTKTPQTLPRRGGSQSTHSSLR